MQNFHITIRVLQIKETSELLKNKENKREFVHHELIQFFETCATL